MKILVFIWLQKRCPRNSFQNKQCQCQEFTVGLACYKEGHCRSRSIIPSSLLDTQLRKRYYEVKKRRLLKQRNFKSENRNVTKKIQLDNGISYSLALATSASMAHQSSAGPISSLPSSSMTHESSQNQVFDSFLLLPALMPRNTSASRPAAEFRRRADSLNGEPISISPSPDKW